MENESEELLSAQVDSSAESFTKKPLKKDISPQFAQWLEQCENENSAEKKLRLSLDFMRATLSESGSVRFKDFWEVRRLCLGLFKENIPLKTRALFWEEYIELSSEARRLKQLLDEQSAFTVEQIELAILSLESDVEHFALLLSHSPALVFPHKGLLLKEKGEMYTTLQKELQLLNVLAARTSSLRKEILKTDMRVRVKNKLLERLSACGDHIFPKRKTLIKEVSQTFLRDVEHFVATHFTSGEAKKLPLHVLREEIKSLQGMAKTLTLSSSSFTETRLKLSSCWDEVREQEKERKKEIHQKKQTQKENTTLVREKITAFAEQCRSGMSAQECHTHSQEIADYMKTLQLEREDVKILKEELTQAKKIILDREREKEEQRLQKEREEERERRARIQAFKEELEKLVQETEEYEIGVLQGKYQELHTTFDGLGLNKMERQLIERQFKQLKDGIAGKKEKALLALSEEELKSLDELKNLLRERVERRSEIKNQLEQYRKALGGSGFDFEKAMLQRELIESEKASLEKIDRAIEELEQKIEDIEG